MYLLSQEVTLEWQLLKTENVIALGALDLIYINPLGEETYVVAPLLSENYTAPTSDTAGSVTELFTPELEGFWRIRLVTGNSEDYAILAKMEMYVFDSTTTTSPYSVEIGKPTPYDINYYLQGFVVANEIYGSFVASRTISLAEDVPGSVAICETVGAFFNSEFEIIQNDTVIGTITFLPNSFIGTIVCAPVLLQPGDKLKIKVATNTDAAISDIAINIVGCCSVVPCTVF